MDFSNPSGTTRDDAGRYVDDLLELLAAHDLVHRRQIERIKEAVL